MKHTIISFKTDEKTKVYLQKVAKEKDMSVSAVIREAIRIMKSQEEK